LQGGVTMKKTAVAIALIIIVRSVMAHAESPTAAAYLPSPAKRQETGRKLVIATGGLASVGWSF
jgi:hypothetical protein